MRSGEKGSRRERENCEQFRFHGLISLSLSSSGRLFLAVLPL
jgi:hypothetical protein